MKIQNLIDSRSIIEIDLDPESDKSHEGVCLKDSDEATILVNYNEDENELDGFSIFRGKDIVRFLPESSEYPKEQLKVFKDKLDVNLICNFKTGLEEAAKFGLISITTKDDIESYYVAKLLELSEEEVVLHLVDEDGKWLDELEIELDDVLYFSFNTKYNEILQAKKAGHR